MTEHHRVADRSSARGFLFAPERAADLRLDAKDVEELRRNTQPAETLRLGRSGERVSAIVENREVREAAILRAEVEEVRRR